MIEIKSMNEGDTSAIARDLAGVMPPGGVVLLSGDLGAGKTVFTRAFIHALMGRHDVNVTSPTFNIVVGYDAPSGYVAHYDLYRLKDPEELIEIGMDEIGVNRASVIEWPDRLGDFGARMKNVVSVHIDILGAEARVFNIDLSRIGVSVDTGMVLAAGLGTRMAPLTAHAPKPLVPVNGRPILSYVCDSLVSAGVTRCIMNAHYFPEKIDEFVAGNAQFDQITVSHEDELLETGGGILRALPLINRDMFVAINGDALLTDGVGLPFFTRLMAAFDPARMDILLLLYPVDAPTITETVGDYHMGVDGRLTRALDLTGAYMFAGARILHARVFDGVAQGRFSFRDQMDAAQKAARLYGLVHTGDWHHLSTPGDVARVGEYLAAADTKKQAVG